jgi:hypothetical protein
MAVQILEQSTMKELKNNGIILLRVLTGMTVVLPAWYLTTITKAKPK